MLLKEIKKNLNESSIVLSDVWIGYSKLSYFFKEHTAVNHSKEFVNAVDRTHTNTIEEIGVHLKSMFAIERYSKNKILFLLDFFYEFME